MNRRTVEMLSFFALAILALALIVVAAKEAGVL